MKFLSYILLPVSCLYAVVLRFRHLLYDLKILHSGKGALPTIVVGNLNLGGTGKTPHTAYLLELLKNHHPALLSRGYGRKTRGFRLANREDHALTIGDEPAEIHLALPDIPVAVCEDRLLGIDQLKQLSNAKLVILDDAFQHRRLQPDLSILLIDFGHPIWDDFLLPSGSLRDLKYRKKAADILLITKCPADLSAKDMEDCKRKLQPESRQQVFFTTIEYGDVVQFGGPAVSLSKGDNILGMAGLAKPHPLKDYLDSTFNLKKFKEYPDHHTFSPLELRMLIEECGTFAPPVKAIVTSRKDAMRIRTIEENLSMPFFYQPVRIKFLKDEEKFNQLLQTYTTKFLAKT